MDDIDAVNGPPANPWWTSPPTPTDPIEVLRELIALLDREMRDFYAR